MKRTRRPVFPLGDVIDWGCDGYMLRGHLSIEDATEYITCWSCEAGIQYEFVSHSYARIMPNHDGFTWHESAPGRGAFAVTFVREVHMSSPRWLKFSRSIDLLEIENAFEIAIRDAVLEERERCAKVAESFIPSGFTGEHKNLGNAFAVARDDRARTIAETIRRKPE